MQSRRLCTVFPSSERRVNFFFFFYFYFCTVTFP